MDNLSIENLESVVTKSIINTLNDLHIPFELTDGHDTKLYGKDSIIDSIVLVNIIIDIEEEIQNSFNIPLQIANDAAFSTKRSPFRTINSLIHFIAKQLDAKT